MSPRRQPPISPEEPLNLIPIMNVVMILIPLLLMGVVFEQIGTVPISPPSCCAQVEPPSRPPLALFIEVGTQGFRVTGNMPDAAPSEGCAVTGITICNREARDVRGLLQEMQELRQRADAAPHAKELLAASDARLHQARAAYDLRGLYNEVITLQRAWPDERRVTLSAAPEIPMELVITTADLLRDRLVSPHPEGTFATDAEFYAALQQRDARGAPIGLFPEVQLAAAR